MAAAGKRCRDLIKEPTFMTKKRFDSVWDASEDTPEVAENIKLRSTLMMAVELKVRKAA